MKNITILLALLVAYFPVPVQSGNGDMALIPSGYFLMGSAEGQADERPVHRVHVDAFYMDRYPVTNAEYAHFLNAFGNRVEEGKKYGWTWTAPFLPGSARFGKRTAISNLSPGMKTTR